MTRMVTPPTAQVSVVNQQLYLWVKGLETKVNNLLQEVGVLKDDLLEKNDQLRKEVKVLTDDFFEMKHAQTKTLQKMDIIIKELKQTAGSEEVQVLKKYVDLWNPLHFATQQDVARIVEQQLHGKKETHKYLKKHIG